MSAMNQRPAQPHSPAAQPVGARTRLRVLPVPVSEPRALERAARPESVASTQGALTLDLPDGRLASAGWVAEAAPPPGCGPTLPDPAGTTRAIVKAVVEVLAGARPASHLVRWVSRDVHETVVHRAALATRLRRGAAGTWRQAVVRAVRVSSPAVGVVEASAVIMDGDRVRAVALRLEVRGGRWQATAIEIG